MFVSKQLIKRSTRWAVPPAEAVAKNAIDVSGLPELKSHSIGSEVSSASDVLRRVGVVHLKGVVGSSRINWAVERVPGLLYATPREIEKNLLCFQSSDIREPSVTSKEQRELWNFARSEVVMNDVEQVTGEKPRITSCIVGRMGIGGSLPAHVHNVA